MSSDSGFDVDDPSSIIGCGRSVEVLTAVLTLEDASREANGLSSGGLNISPMVESSDNLVRNPSGEGI